jgi:hypothetical protein
MDMSAAVSGDKSDQTQPKKTGELESKGLSAASSPSTSLPGTQGAAQSDRDVICVVREEFPGHSSSAPSAASGQ